MSSRYFLSLGILFLPVFLISQEKSKSIKLNFSQKRVQSLYKRKKYGRCISIGHKRLNKGNLDRVTYYYLGLSYFKSYESVQKNYLFDRSLRYLDYSNFSTNKLVNQLAQDDSDLLELIHKTLLSLAEDDIFRNFTKSAKRLKYAKTVFNDNTNYLTKWLKPKQNQEKLEQISQLGRSSYQNIAEELIDLFGKGYFKTTSLSSFVLKRMKSSIQPLHEKLMDKVSNYYGLKEFEGSKHNKIVVSFFQRLGYDYITDDETPWCAAFINFCAKEIGANYPKSLRARHWMNCGVSIDNPTIGDIAVFGYGGASGTSGHVSIYISEDSENIYCLGGNQSNEVNISSYCKEDLLGFRKLTPK